ncbi:MAG: hypothetical protein LBM72_02300 [Mycoplasmataceae bacterium]|nr:hypothetical protein [Mycoplasmataceae bacterium]
MVKFMAYVRLSIIVVNAILFGLFMSLDSIYYAINDLSNFFHGHFVTRGNTDYLPLENVLTLIIFIYIFSTIALTITYCFLHVYVSGKGWCEPLSKYEIYTLSVFIIVSTFLMVMSFVIVIGLGWDMNSGSTTWKNVLAYGIPLLDLLTVLPILILNTMSYVENLWELHTSSIKTNKTDKTRYQVKMAVTMFIMIALSFIFVFWSRPEDMLNSLGLITSVFTGPNWYGKVLQFITMYAMLLFIIVIFILCIIWFAVRIRREQKHLIKELPRYEFIVLMLALIVVTIFLLSTSVISMWTNFDKTKEIFWVTGILDIALVIPTYVLYSTYYIINMERIAHAQ